jgi:hypothetical protein
METKMETKDLNSIGLAYLEMVEKRNIEAKKNHADTLHKNQKALDVHSDEDEDHNDDPTDGDGDIDAADLKKLRKDADKDDKKFDKKKKSSKKDDDQDKFKAYSGDDTDGQQGAAIGEDAKYPHMMYDPKTGKEFKAETPADHEKYAKMGYTHDKPEEIDEASKEGTIRIIDLSDAHPDNRMGATEKSGFQVQRMTKGKFANQGKPYAKKAHAEKERSTGQASMQFEAKNITTDDNALVSFYQIHSTSPKPRLAGHMNMQVLGGQHQMSAADIKKISNLAVKAGVGRVAGVPNSMLSKHIADYKNENKPAPPKIAVALSQHHAKEKMKSLGESADLQEGAARQAALAKGLMDYCKEIGKDHMDHKDFADHAKHVKAGNWDKARAHADDQDTEVREKIHTLAIDHLGQGAASELYGGDRVSLSKNKGDGKLHASYNESVNVDDVLALIDQGYTLDQAEAMVAEACGGGGGGGTGGPQGGLHASRKYPDDKKLLKASRKQSKAGDNDRNMANDQRSIPAKGADTAPVRPGTKQQQRDFDKAARMAKSKDKVSVAKAPWDTKDEGFTSDAQRKAVWASKNDAKNEELHGNQHKLDHNKDGRIDAGDMKKVRKHGAVQKESVMDRVSNMVEDIRVNIQEDRDQDQEDRNDRAGPGGKYISYFDSDNAAIKRQLELGPKGKYKNAQKRIDAHVSGKKHNPAIADMISKRNKPNSGTNVVQMKRAAKINELDKKTLGSYAKKAMDDLDTQSRFATEYEKRGMAAKSTAVQDRNFKKANRADDKFRNRKAGINTAIDKMTKEGTAKINELSPTTMQSYQKKADKASTKSFKKADDIEDKASDKGDDVWSSKSKASQKHSKMMGTGEKRAAGARLARKKLAKINELDKKTLGSYINKAADDVEYRAYALGAQEPTELGSVRKGRNRIKGIAKATDRLTKESVQEAAKPTGIHHPIDPTPGKEVNSKDAAGRAADIRASRNPLSMTEKEFVEMHQVPTTVDPAFDGNVAAKQTAENAKKAPIKQAKTPNTPTAMGDQKAVKSTEAPAANAGVVGESYMDKYAKYIRGEI